MFTDFYGDEGKKIENSSAFDSSQKKIDFQLPQVSFKKNPEIGPLVSTIN